jgi:peptidoglycan/LPS O-acetylase OafA/YrhL
LFTALARAGWCGVDLFFVLSGFLITGILYDSKGSTSYYRSFYARRVLRIFPLYYAVIFFSVVILPALFPASDLAVLGERALNRWSAIWYLLYLSNVVVALDGFHHPILSISWSLAIEEQFYLVWPLVVHALSRGALIRVCVMLVFFAPLFRTALWWLDARPDAIYVLTPGRADALAVGALIALVLRGASGLAPLARWARLAGPAAAAVVLWMIASDPEASWEAPLMQTAGYSLLAVAFGSLVVLTLAGGSNGRLAAVLSASFLRTFGKYSYALYLFHVPVRRVIRDNFYGPAQFPIWAGSQLPGQLLFYVVATAPALLLAWISWNLLEKRALALKRFFPYGR